MTESRPTPLLPALPAGWRRLRSPWVPNAIGVHDAADALTLLEIVRPDGSFERFPLAELLGRSDLDRETDALYIRVRPAEPGRRVETEELDEGRLLDRGPDGELLGIELLSPLAFGVDLDHLPRRDLVAAVCAAHGIATRA